LSWELDYTDETLQDLAAVPLELQGAVESHLLRLAAAPVSISHKAVFPYASSGQIFPFTVTTMTGQLHHFTVFFLYDQDERFLHIARVIHQSR
jgi:hypothetical protein